MSVFVFSTLTGSHKYPIYRKPREGGDALPKMESYVLIHGGANLATKHLVTPKGVVTKLTDEAYVRLQTNEAFKRHLERGYLKVEDEDYSPEDVAEDMTARDQSAPMRPEDFGNKAPTTAESSEPPTPQTEIRSRSGFESAASNVPGEPVATSEPGSMTGEDDAAGSSETEKPRKRRSRPKKDQ